MSVWDKGQSTPTNTCTRQSPECVCRTRAHTVRTSHASGQFVVAQSTSLSTASDRSGSPVLLSQNSSW